MKRFKSVIAALVLSLFCFVNVSFAISTSVLPDGVGEGYDTTDLTSQECRDVVLAFENSGENYLAQNTEVGDMILSCALKSGYIKFWMIPYFVRYILEFVVELSAVIVVLMIMVGAYYYIIGGVTDDKEKGKTIITYAIGGFVLVMVSWGIVSILLLALTA